MDWRQHLHAIDKKNATTWTTLKDRQHTPLPVVRFACHQKLPFCASIDTNRSLWIHDTEAGEMMAEKATKPYLKHELDINYHFAWHPTKPIVAVAYYGSILLYHLDKGTIWKHDNFSGIPYFSYHGDWVWGAAIWGEDKALLRISSYTDTTLQSLHKMGLGHTNNLAVGESCFLTEDKADSGPGRKSITLRSIHGNEAKLIAAFNRSEGNWIYPRVQDKRFVAVNKNIISIYTPHE